MTSKFTSEASRSERNRRFVSYILLITSLLIFGGFSWRLTYIVQVGEIAGVSIAERRDSTYYGRNSVETQRGTIYDRDGQVIATDTLSYTVRAVLSETYVDNGRPYLEADQIEEVATIFATYLDIPAIETTKILSDAFNQEEPPFQIEFGSRGSWIRVTDRNLISTALKEKEINGIYFDASSRRSYPNGVFASHLVGITTEQENRRVGTSGIEGAFNDVLENRVGLEEFQKNAAGNPVPKTDVTIEEGKDGGDIYTTLDSGLKLLTEGLMDEVFVDTQPENLTVVLIEAKTGEILSMAQRPSFHPETQTGMTDPAFIWRNLLTEEMYEPGSTIKLATIAAAIDEGVFDPNESFTPTNFQVEDRVVNDHDLGQNGPLNMRQAFSWSSNIGMVRLQEKMAVERWNDYLINFGFGQSTGSGLPQEIQGTVPTENRVDAAMSAYGQAIGVSQIQMMQMFSAFANEGRMIRPQLIKQIGDTSQVSPEFIAQPISADASNTVLSYMTDVVEDARYGTAYGLYQLEDHQISVKTGTAQVAREDGDGYLSGDNEYIYSAVSIYPTDDPQFILYVTIKNPQRYETTDLARIVNPLMERSMAMWQFR